MDFVLLVTFVSIIIVAGASAFVGYCMGKEAGESDGYKLGFHDGVCGYPPQVSVYQEAHR